MSEDRILGSLADGRGILDFKLLPCGSFFQTFKSTQPVKVISDPFSVVPLQVLLADINHSK